MCIRYLGTQHIEALPFPTRRSSDLWSHSFVLGPHKHQAFPHFVRQGHIRVWRAAFAHGVCWRLSGIRHQGSKGGRAGCRLDNEWNIYWPDFRSHARFCCQNHPRFAPVISICSRISFLTASMPDIKTPLLLKWASSDISVVTIHIAWRILLASIGSTPHHTHPASQLSCNLREKAVTLQKRCKKNELIFLLYFHDKNQLVRREFHIVQPVENFFCWNFLLTTSCW